MSEAVLLMQELGPDEPPTPAASRALAYAADAMRELDDLASEGAQLSEAYRWAAWALHNAAVAISEARGRAATRRRFIPSRRIAVTNPESAAF